MAWISRACLSNRIPFVDRSGCGVLSLRTSIGFASLRRWRPPLRATPSPDPSPLVASSCADAGRGGDSSSRDRGKPLLAAARSVAAARSRNPGIDGARRPDPRETHGARARPGRPGPRSAPVPRERGRRRARRAATKGGARLAPGISLHPHVPAEGRAASSQLARRPRSRRMRESSSPPHRDRTCQRRSRLHRDRDHGQRREHGSGAVRLVFRRRFRVCFRRGKLDHARVRGAHADADTLPAERADIEIGATLARPRLAPGVAPGGAGDRRRQHAHQPERGMGASEASGDLGIPEFFGRIEARRHPRRRHRSTSSISARTRSPSRRASDRRLSARTTAPSPDGPGRPSSRAAASCTGSQEKSAAPASARSSSPARRARSAELQRPDPGEFLGRDREARPREIELDIQPICREIGHGAEDPGTGERRRQDVGGATNPGFVRHAPGRRDVRQTPAGAIPGHGGVAPHPDHHACPLRRRQRDAGQRFPRRRHGPDLLRQGDGQIVRRKARADHRERDRRRRSVSPERRRQREPPRNPPPFAPHRPRRRSPPPQPRSTGRLSSVVTVGRARGGAEGRSPAE